jgi:DTW domain-containing protein YfiP
VVLDRDFPEKLDGSAALIVLDGSWSQAARMARREPALRSLPRVKLPPGPRSSYRLRTQQDPARVCTFEAVARALGVLEGPEVQQALESFFRVMVERMLWARGKLRASEVAGGLPEGVGA